MIEKSPELKFRKKGINLFEGSDTQDND